MKGFSSDYERTSEFTMASIMRARFDGMAGRARMALQRVSELACRKPDDPLVLHAMGALSEEFLGSGIEAFNLYRKAWNNIGKYHGLRFKIFPPPVPVKQLETQLLERLCIFEPDAETKKRWFALLQNHDFPQDKLNALHSHIEAIEMGVPCWQIMVNNADLLNTSDMAGEKAALLETALAFGQAPPEHEVMIRKHRAVALRSLDQNAAAVRQANFENFPPEDRIALKAAVKEIEQAIKVDPYDAELWNFKAAWHSLLNEWSNVIEAADKALELRPHGYLKPMINKAGALIRLDRLDEARSVLSSALQQARNLGERGDESLCMKKMELLEFAEKGLKPSRKDMLEASALFIKGVRVTATRFMDYCNESDGTHGAAAGLFRRINGISFNSCIQVLAEFITDFPPEAAMVILAQGLDMPGARSLLEQCLNALVWLACNAQGVLQKDALRCLVIWGLLGKDHEHIAHGFRYCIRKFQEYGNLGRDEARSMLEDEITSVNSIFLDFLD